MTGSGTLRDIGNASIFGAATARTGGDVFNLSGFTLTIDEDTQYGKSGNNAAAGTATSLGNITVDAAKGGTLNIDATKVWLIPFTGGSGTLTAGTQITIGGVTCYTIGLYSALNVAPVLTGVAAGWLKVTAASGTPGTITSGTYAGYTITANGAAVRGWIELRGDEGSTITANRLGTVNITGSWFELGNTSGSSATTYQIPTNGMLLYIPAVWVDSDTVNITGASWSGGVATYTVASHKFTVGEELTVKSVTPSGYNGVDMVITAVTATTFSVAMAANPGTWSSGGTASVLEPYPCAGSLAVASSTATDIRGKCCWVSTAGLLRFGSDGTNTVGYVPSAGRRIVVPNIMTGSCLTTARNVNALPNATLATRYDFTTSGGGVVNISKANLNWYPSIAQAYSFSAKYVGVATQISLTEISQPMANVGIVVGQEAANTQTALILGLCYAGGTFNACTFTRAALATAVYINTVTDCSGFTFNRCRSESRLLKANVGAGAWSLLRAVDCTWNDDQVIGAKNLLNGCLRVTFNNSRFADRIVLTTNTTAATVNTWMEFVTAASYYVTLNGLDFFGIADVAPYCGTSLGMVNVAVAGCQNFKIRNIGTYAAPLNIGHTTAANSAGNVLTIMASGAAADFLCQRIYVSNTRLNGFYYVSATVPDNSSTRITLENCFTDYADSADLNNMLNLTRKGIGGVPSVAAATGIYGTHFFDCHTSTTAGRLCIIMNEPSSLTTSQVTLTGGAAFTAGGGLYMPTIGMTATFELPYYCIGHTGFQNSAGIMAGGTATNYNYNYSIDKNDGAGWSAMTTANYTATTLATALNGLTGIDAAKGFKLRLKITTTVGNTTAITSFYLLTSSTTTTQAYQYPLDTATVSVSGLVTGSRIVAKKVSDGTVLANMPESSGVATFTTDYIGAVSIEARKASGSPYYIPWNTQVTTISGSTVSATALQQLDE